MRDQIYARKPACCTLAATSISRAAPTPARVAAGDQGLDYSWYIGICGDGNFLYTGTKRRLPAVLHFAWDDGLTWTAYQGGTQTFSTDPF